ncbi:MAG: hypothetical protein QM764_02465 [Chitinophagaceae bacterium]
MGRLFFFSVAIIAALSSCAQSSSHMDFETYDPVSTLVVPEHKLTKAKFPFIDVHNHQWDGTGPGYQKAGVADGCTEHEDNDQSQRTWL